MSDTLVCRRYNHVPAYVKFMNYFLFRLSLHINIPVLPGDTFDINLEDFKESDDNVYLYMKNPGYHYKLYKSCVK